MSPKSKKGKIAHHPLLATQIDATRRAVFLTAWQRSNPPQGKIRSPVFADLYTADISEDVRGNIFRHVVGWGGNRLVFVSTFHGNDRSPKVNRRPPLIRTIRFNLTPSTVEKPGQ